MASSLAQKSANSSFSFAAHPATKFFPLDLSQPVYRFYAAAATAAVGGADSAAVTSLLPSAKSFAQVGGGTQTPPCQPQSQQSQHMPLIDAALLQQLRDDVKFEAVVKAEKFFAPNALNLNLAFALDAVGLRKNDSAKRSVNDARNGGSAVGDEAAMNERDVLPSAFAPFRADAIVKKPLVSGLLEPYKAQVIAANFGQPTVITSSHCTEITNNVSDANDELKLSYPLSLNTLQTTPSVYNSTVSQAQTQIQMERQQQQLTQLELNNCHAQAEKNFLKRRHDESLASISQRHVATALMPTTRSIVRSPSATTTGCTNNNNINNNNNVTSGQTTCSNNKTSVVVLGGQQASISYHNFLPYSTLKDSAASLENADDSQAQHASSAASTHDDAPLAAVDGNDDAQDNKEDSANSSTKKRKELVRDAAYWERRRKNNDAAKRSRDSRRKKEDEVTIRAAILEQENFRLRFEIEQLKSEVERHRILAIGCCANNNNNNNNVINDDNNNNCSSKDNNNNNNNNSLIFNKNDNNLSRRLELPAMTKAIFIEDSRRQPSLVIKSRNINNNNNNNNEVNSQRQQENNNNIISAPTVINACQNF